MVLVPVATQWPQEEVKNARQEVVVAVLLGCCFKRSVD